MPAKKYRVKLTEAERNDLKDLLNKGRIAARKQTHARILLQCDESGVNPVKNDRAIAEALNTSARSVERVRQRFVEEGLESALNPKVQERSYYKKLDGAAEAFLVATACTQAPEGELGGRCSYWPTNWWNASWSIPSAMKRLGKH